MATGETFNPAEQTVTRFDSSPLRAGKYQVQLIPGQIEVQRSSGESGTGLAYVKVRFTVLGTGKDGGKNRILFHSFFLSLEPGKDGQVAPNRGGGLSDFLLAAGSAPNLLVVTDKDMKSQREVRVIEAGSVTDALNQVGTITLTATVKIEAGDKTYGPKNKITGFAPAI